MKPLGDRVIIRRTAAEEKIGSFYVPDGAKEKPLEGEVTHVGSGRYFDGKRIPLDVKVKDKVLFGKYSGVETKIKGEDVLILREEEILVVL
jgi:chaperonin GroES